MIEVYISSFSLLNGCTKMNIDFFINSSSIHWIVIILTIKIPCRFRWYGIIGPGGLIAASTAVIAFVYGHWDLDPVLRLRIAKEPHQTPEL